MVGAAAVVAGEHIERAVEGQRHIAVLATGHPAALLALHHRCPPAAVLEEDGLLAMLQGLANTGQKEW